MIRPFVEHTVRILQRAISGTDEDALRAVVLVGGSAHVPLVAEVVSAAVRVRVVAAADPVTAVARGAALAGGKVAKPTVQAQALPVTPSVTPAAGVTDLMRFDDIDAEVADIGPPPPRPPVEIAPLDPPARGLARLARRSRGGAEVDELDRAERSWDFEHDGDRADRADRDLVPARERDRDFEEPRGRRRRRDDDEDDA
jgi:hypothetical protein